MKVVKAFLNLNKINTYAFGAFVVIYRLIKVIKFLSEERPDNKLVITLSKVSNSLEAVFNVLKLILKLFGQDVSTFALSDADNLEDSLRELDLACDDLKKLY